jgi:hypothetical protein
MAFEDFWMSQTEEPTGASLRFSGSQFLTRNPSITTNRTTFTIAFWVKLGRVNSPPAQTFFSVSGTSNFDAFNVY